jgi:basic amino acid/polyamine antiporter, APA family
VPVFAILLQGAAACLIALSGTYGQILSYVVAVDFIWFAMTGATLFVFRRRDTGKAWFQVPGHPWTSAFFVAACAVTVVGTLYNHPVNSLIGFLILAAGVPTCLWFRRRRQTA